MWEMRLGLCRLLVRVEIRTWEGEGEEWRRERMRVDIGCSTDVDSCTSARGMSRAKVTTM